MIDNYKIKNALISVSDKTGIVEFAAQLNKLGITIYSTGGTEKLLAENNILVKKMFTLRYYLCSESVHKNTTDRTFLLKVLSVLCCGKIIIVLVLILS